MESLRGMGGQSWSHPLQSSSNGTSSYICPRSGPKWPETTPFWHYRRRAIYISYVLVRMWVSQSSITGSITGSYIYPVMRQWLGWRGSNRAKSTPQISVWIASETLFIITIRSVPKSAPSNVGVPRSESSIFMGTCNCVSFQKRSNYGHLYRSTIQALEPPIIPLALFGTKPLVMFTKPWRPIHYCKGRTIDICFD